MRAPPAPRVLLHGFAERADEVVSLKVRVPAQAWREETQRLLGTGERAAHATLEAELAAPVDELWYPTTHDTVQIVVPRLRSEDRGRRGRAAGNVTYTIGAVRPICTRTRRSNLIHRFLVSLQHDPLF